MDRFRLEWVATHSSMLFMIVMTVMLAKPSEVEVRKEIRALKTTARKIAASPEAAREFLRKNGFITKNNKLHKRYR